MKKEKFFHFIFPLIQSFFFFLIWNQLYEKKMKMKKKTKEAYLIEFFEQLDFMMEPFGSKKLKTIRLNDILILIEIFLERICFTSERIERLNWLIIESTFRISSPFQDWTDNWEKIRTKERKREREGKNLDCNQQNR